jgi:beta-phosphoglucomutase
MRKNPEAFLFDLNGTMIDDMQYHLEIWFEVINKELGANLTREEIRSQMYGKNEEVLIRIFGESRFKQFNLKQSRKRRRNDTRKFISLTCNFCPGCGISFNRQKKKKLRWASVWQRRLSTSISCWTI